MQHNNNEHDLKQLSLVSHPSGFATQQAHNSQAQNRLCLVPTWEKTIW